MIDRKLVHANSYEKAARIAQALGFERFTYISRPEQLQGIDSTVLYAGYGWNPEVISEAEHRRITIEWVHT